MKNNFSIRNLCSDDIFPMCDIIGKCGISEFKNCFVKPVEGENSYNKGVNMVFDMTGVICKNISSCKCELYTFLSDLSGTSEKEIATLEPAEFVCLIKAVLNKKEFKDFFTVVSEFFISD